MITAIPLALLILLMCALFATGIWSGWSARGVFEASEDRKALARIGDDLKSIPNLCTRDPGHDGPCNGFPAATCPSAYAPIGVHGRANDGTPAGIVLQPPAPAVFKTQSGETLESPRTWDKRLEQFGGPKSIPYEELEGMFLDQFLLRFFHELMPQTWNVRIPEGSKSPWPAFVWLCPWAKEMPLLFEQMTGYSLNDIQLNNAIAEWARRLSKTEVRQ